MHPFQEKLNLPEAIFTRIDHADAMVAEVYKISAPGRPDSILKVCSRPKDFLRESYFLELFANKIPVPHVLQLIDSAIWMECLEGDLIQAEEIEHNLAKEIGTLLAKIHLERTDKYGDLTDPVSLSTDPKVPFSLKFEEGLEECQGHLPQELLEKCKRLFKQDIHLLNHVDGPCIIHRDFRPGNIIAAHGKVQGIIDWSSARSGFAEEDFCFLECLDWPIHCKKAFLEGYGSIRPVPDFKTVMPILRLSRAVAVVGFTVKRGTWKTRDATFYQINRRYLEEGFKGASSQQQS